MWPRTSDPLSERPCRNETPPRCVVPDGSIDQGAGIVYKARLAHTWNWTITSDFCDVNACQRASFPASALMMAGSVPQIAAKWRQTGPQYQGEFNSLTRLRYSPLSGKLSQGQMWFARQASASKPGGVGRVPCDRWTAAF